MHQGTQLRPTCTTSASASRATRASTASTSSTRSSRCSTSTRSTWSPPTAGSRTATRTGGSMDYERLSKGYEYGLSKIYEMVINNDPSYAYLLESNMDVDQKLVMAHVYGHVDFFKNNFMFRHTNRKMMDQMANHATRAPLPGQARRGAGRGLHRPLPVAGEPHRLPVTVREAPPRPPRGGRRAKGGEGFKTEREYMREFINPPEFLAAEQKRLDEEAARSEVPGATGARLAAVPARARRSSAGSTTSSPSSARRRTTSPRRVRRRS